MGAALGYLEYHKLAQEQKLRLPAFITASCLFLLVALVVIWASVNAGLSGVWTLYALTGLAALPGGVLALIAWLRRHKAGEPR